MIESTYDKARLQAPKLSHLYPVINHFPGEKRKLYLAQLSASSCIWNTTKDPVHCSLFQVYLGASYLVLSMTYPRFQRFISSPLWFMQTFLAGFLAN